MILVLITTIVCIGALILHKHYKKLARMELLTANIPPGPKGYPIIGAAFELVKGNDVHENLVRIMELYSKEKRIIKLWLGLKLFIILSSPDDIEEILSSPNYINKSFVYSFMEAVIGKNNMLTTNGVKWMNRRKLIMPSFKKKMIEQFLNKFNKHSKLLVENFKGELSKPGFDVSDYNNLFTTDVILETALGVEFGIQQKKNFELCRDVLRKLEYMFTHRVTRPWIYPDIIFFMTKIGQEGKKLRKKLTTIIQEIIDTKERHRKEERVLLVNKEETDDVIGEKNRKAFVDVLLDSHEDGDGHLTNEDIVGEVALIIAAGQSTTAATISYALHALSKHQDIQDKVVEELNEIFDGSERDPTFNDVNNMKYMEMVLKETMRLWPAVPFIARSVPMDIHLKSGYTLPAGCEIGIFIYALHRNPDVYPNPEVFDPERFNNENSQGRSVYAHCPFAAGPRICIGHRYAMAEMKIALSYILRSYKILPSSKDFPEMKLTAEMILHSSTGVNIKIERR